MSPPFIAVMVAPGLGLANLILKRHFGGDASFAGADLALGGSSLLLSWMTHAILRGNFPLGGEGLIYLSYCVGALLLWFFCLAVASKRNLSAFLLSGMLGSAVLILAVWSVNHVMEKGA